MDTDDAAASGICARGVHSGAIRLDQVISQSFTDAGVERVNSRRYHAGQTDWFLLHCARAIPATPDLALSSLYAAADSFPHIAAAGIRLNVRHPRRSDAVSDLRFGVTKGW